MVTNGKRNGLRFDMFESFWSYPPIRKTWADNNLTYKMNMNAFLMKSIQTRLRKSPSLWKDHIIWYWHHCLFTIAYLRKAVWPKHCKLNSSVGTWCFVGSYNKRSCWHFKLPLSFLPLIFLKCPARVMRSITKTCFMFAEPDICVYIM